MDCFHSLMVNLLDSLLIKINGPSFEDCLGSFYTEEDLCFFLFYEGTWLPRFSGLGSLQGSKATGSQEATQRIPVACCLLRPRPPLPPCPGPAEVRGPSKAGGLHHHCGLRPLLWPLLLPLAPQQTQKGTSSLTLVSHSDVWGS